MSLDIDCTACSKDQEAREFREASLETFAYLSLFIGINHITEKNFAEVWRRVDRYESLCGSLSHRRLTEAEVRHYIGARTNVSNLTKAAFEAFIKRVLLTQAERKARIAAKQEA